MNNGDFLRDMLAKADREGYAVPSFNYSCAWDFLAIIEAAEEEKAPVMVASHALVFNMITPEINAAMGAAAMAKANIPLIHHLDHSDEVAICNKAIDLGYPSVMIDASALSLEDNISAVKEVVEHAKSNKVCVEAEIGKIKGRGYEGGYGGDDFLAQVDDAVRLVEDTGVDTLAVGIGTAHGFYEGKPEIHFDRLEEINAAVDVPLVLHGGSGIPEADIRQAIKGGINKINVGTIIHCTLMNSFRKDLIELGDNQFTLDIARPAMDEVKKVVKGWIRKCMADGKA
ncbi:MAG: class II fructose-bisphosphate aldolase [Spirochaetales bacterium]|uniref:Class II fructose-bisphosphate aldolase n=1 Tax=Candidatus Thalassospirochaeta sargassi TaxID=3119039 RepID=A0AAJ1IFK0_9SPIO|nr:class II fructose-bisphosphate aldolase [Spirochaetales bacterium]